MKTPEACEREGLSYTDHILGLVKEHYEVEVPADDVVAIHPTKKEGFCILKIWNRKAGSAYQKLCTAIKTGGKFGRERREKQAEERGERRRGQEERTQRVRPNFWATFQLTRRRSDLISKLKSLKKEKKISQFSSNENGDIFIKVDQKQKNQRLTYDWKVFNSKTVTIEEVMKLVSKGEEE